MRALNYAKFYPQVECVTNQVALLFDRLEEFPNLADATIVVLGDHGSRISAGHRWVRGPRRIKKYSIQDLVDNHSALFAIRGPGISPGYDLRHTSIQRLTAEYLGDSDDLGPDNRTIVVLAAPNKVKVLPMPDFGPSSN